MTWSLVSVTITVQKADMDAKDGRNSKCIQELVRGNPKALERKLECLKNVGTAQNKLL